MSRKNTYNLDNTTTGAELTSAASHDAMATDSQTFQQRLRDRSSDAIKAATEHVPAHTATSLNLTYRLTDTGVVMVDRATGRRVGNELPRR